jgi:glycosyltransferase involved in cell wall biosynthesis
MRHKIILTFLGYYLPGYKAGGPIRTLENMTKALNDDFLFKIITSDRDMNDDSSYKGIEVNKWVNVESSKVFYLSPDNINPKYILNIIKETEYDILYLNSFFSLKFTILPLILRRLNFFSSKSIIVAPRGEFSEGALKIKSLKKRFFIRFAKFLKLYDDIVWQASSNYEKEDIKRVFNNKLNVVIAPDLPGQSHKEKQVKRNPKESGSIKILFLSRISKKKNLDYALKLVQKLSGNVVFNIYGPLEDKYYWQECKNIISTMSNNIEINYCGSVPHEKVNEIMSNHDLFLFPTHGENFGHVILEALVAGCPVLISDNTPWRNLENKQAGWDINLSDKSGFLKVLNEILNMDSDSYKLLSENARKYGLKHTLDENIVKQNKRLFNKVLS